MTETATVPGALVERRGNVMVITINRPEARNAINSSVSIALGDALEEAQQDPDVWVVVVTGSGDKSFCAGADLSEATDGPGDPARVRADTRFDPARRKGPTGSPRKPKT